MTDDTAFLAAADATLAAIGAALDAAAAADAAAADLDWSVNDGILEIDGGRGGKIIVNRHAVNREIWVAARAGGFHFRAAGGAWRDTRSGERLDERLAHLLREQFGAEVAIHGLPPLAP
ncbi:MAG: iron donor protein CyaY [Burkholderiales bacterium]|nr:iron donor protein CyaY [Burkholderiales bacterium]